MIPYFFASGHLNYARYGLYYLRSMAKLPETVLKAFLDGEHVMRHQPELWNTIWSDQYIESTFMKYGHHIDFQTTHKKADVIIPHQIIHLAKIGKTQITVLAVDTYIFLLLIHAYFENSLTCKLVIRRKNLSRSSVNIKATVENYINILQDKLPAHCLTGCDTVSYLKLEKIQK